MSNMIRSIRSFVPYLLPAALLATAGVLLMGLLYYPNPAAIHAARTPQTVVSMSERYWNAHAEDMLAALLADAVRQLQAERQTQVRVPYYAHERGIFTGERSTGLRAAPFLIENDNDPGRPILIRL